MKKSVNKRTILCILIITTLIYSSIFVSVGTTGQKSLVEYSSLEFMEADGVTTKITDIYGGTQIFDGMLKSESLTDNASAELIASYEVIMNGNVLINMTLYDSDEDKGLDNKNNYSAEKGSTTLDQASGGKYYSATFPVMDGDEVYEAFITGLSNTAGEGSVPVSSIDEAITNAISKNQKYIDIEDASFIDAEKILHNDENTDADTQLCWAGTASNILHYTGWADRAITDSTNKDKASNTVNISNEDEILDIFMNAFTDDGGDPYYAFQWFFNGYYYPVRWSSWTQPDNSTNYPYREFLGFLPSYCSFLYTECIDGYTCSDLNDAFDYLTQGHGIGIGVDWEVYDFDTEKYSRNGGHSITLWGYIIDPDLDVDNPARYKKVLFADPDNDKQYTSSGRESLPNTVSISNLSYISANIDGQNCSRWKMEGYGDYEGYKYNSKTKKYDIPYKQIGLISDFSILKRYSSDITPDNGTIHGTYNLFTTPNLIHDVSYISESEGNGVSKTLYTLSEAEAGIYYYDKMLNLSEKNFTTQEPIVNKITLKKNGSDVWNSNSNTSSLNYYGYNGSIWWYTISGKINDYYDDLTEGKYELIIEYDSDNKSTEAFKSDNAVSLKFEIVQEEYYIAKKNGKSININFSPESSGGYIVAAYNTNNKMTGAYYFSSATAGGKNTCRIANSADATTVKFFKLNEGYTPGDGVVKISV